MFKDLFKKSNFEWDYLYDWCLPINNNKTSKFSNGKITIMVNSSQTPMDLLEDKPIILHVNDHMIDPSKLIPPVDLRLHEDFANYDTSQIAL
jgi:casein kinase 1